MKSIAKNTTVLLVVYNAPANAAEDERKKTNTKIIHGERTRREPRVIGACVQFNTYRRSVFGGFVPVGCRMIRASGPEVATAAAAAAPGGRVAFQRARETVNLRPLSAGAAAAAAVRGQYDRILLLRDKRHLTELIPVRDPLPIYIRSRSSTVSLALGSFICVSFYVVPFPPPPKHLIALPSLLFFFSPSKCPSPERTFFVSLPRVPRLPDPVIRRQ